MYTVPDIYVVDKYMFLENNLNTKYFLGMQIQFRYIFSFSSKLLKKTDC